MNNQIKYITAWLTLQEELNPYAVPMAMGIYKQLNSPLDITTSTIIKRIVSNHEAYQVISDKVSDLEYLPLFKYQHYNTAWIPVEYD